MYENLDLDSDEMVAELWAGFEDTAEQMRVLRRDFAPGQHDYNDDYNQFNMRWNDRTVTGMDNCPRMKEAFVDMEYWIEEIIGTSLIVNKEVKAYKLSLIHISEPTRRRGISYAVFCLKKKNSDLCLPRDEPGLGIPGW